MHLTGTVVPIVYTSAEPLEWLLRQNRIGCHIIGKENSLSAQTQTSILVRQQSQEANQVIPTGNQSFWQRFRPLPSGAASTNHIHNRIAVRAVHNSVLAICCLSLTNCPTIYRIHYTYISYIHMKYTTHSIM